MSRQEIGKRHGDSEEDALVNSNSQIFDTVLPWNSSIVFS